MTIIRRLFLLLITIICLVIGGAVFAFTTNVGTKLAFRFASILSHQALTVADVQGQLGSHLLLSHVRYDDASIQFSAENISLDWHALALLKLHVAAETLAIRNADIIIKQTKSEKNKHSVPPFSYQLNQLMLENMTLHYDDNKTLTIKDLRGHILLDEKMSVDVVTQLSQPTALKSHITLDGTLNAYQWNIQLAAANTNWQIQGKGDQNGTAFNTLKGQLLNGSLSADGYVHWSPTPAWKIDAQASKLDTTSFLLQAPKNLSFTLNSAGNLQASYLNVTGLQGQFNYPTGNKTITLPWSASLKANNQNGTCKADLEVLLYQKKFINATLRLPHYQPFDAFTKDQIIDGTLHAQLDGSQLRELKKFGLDDITGRLTADVAATGTFNNKKLQGAINAENLHFTLPALGLTPRNINLKIALANQTINYNGSLQSGPGSLTVQGKTTLEQNNLLSSFVIAGENILVSNTAKIKLYLTPTLKIIQQTDGWHATGKVHIPKGDIDLGDNGQTVTLPRETVIISSTGKKQQTDIQAFFAEIALTLGDDVHLATHGLKSKIGGALTLHDVPGEETRANGKIILTDGSYDLQGQKLAIAQSEVTFINSPVTNPTLNIAATKTIQHAPSATNLGDKQNFIVGLKVTGKADNPVITLFSDPAGWSQSDILSLIVFGQPASTLSNSGVSVLATAAQALGSKSGTPGVASQLTSQLQQTFGLSELGLQSTVGSDTDNTESSTSFVLGKYLSPRLYLSYSLGLDAANTLRLRYLLSKHWSVQTQASTEGSGVDLFYSIGH